MKPRERVCSDECRLESRRRAKAQDAERLKAIYAAQGRSFQPAKKIKGTCLQCRVPFVKLARHFASKPKPKFCDLRCYVAYTQSQPSPLLRGAAIYRGRNWRRIRRDITARDVETCQACGRSEHKKKPPVDHIIPYRLMLDWGLEANVDGNLITVCDSCHSKKTNAIEPKLLRGDLIGFVLGLLKMRYPEDRIRTALQAAELSTSFLDRRVRWAA